VVTASVPPVAAAPPHRRNQPVFKYSFTIDADILPIIVHIHGK
jgi:hypothetical protein